MTRLIGMAVCLATLASIVQLSRAQPPAAGPTLKMIKTIPVGGGTKGWDYPTVDADARRLYLAHGATVTVVDLEKGVAVGEVKVAGSHGIAIVPDKNLAFATSGGETVVVVFDTKDLTVKTKIKTAKGPDAIMYDPASKKIISIGHSSGEITFIDPANLDKEPVNLKIGQTLEFAVGDGKGRIFVNDEKANETIAVDAKEGKVLAHWPLAPTTGPTGLAIDIERHRLFAAGGNGKMAILDSDSGKLIQTVAIGAGVDGAAYDSELKVALSANGKSGDVTIVRETEPGKFTVETVKTLPGAKTIAVDPKTHQFYLPANVPAAAGGTTFGVVVVGAEK